MGKMTITNFGVAALMIELGSERLFVDAFNSLTDAPKLRDGDIVLFTHADHDHFDAGKIPCIKDKEITVIGPPTIVKPLIQSDKAALNQIQTVYSPNNHEPVFLEVSGIRVTSYRTPHFLDWKPVHSSYLVQTGHRSIYITGDSYLTAEMKDDIGDVDYVVCNLVDEGYITGRDDKRFAVHHHMSYMLSVMAAYSPRNIIGVHLIGFDGTISPQDMKKLVTEYHFEEIIIPVEKDEFITL